jgi:predicted metalloprotease with PDZ domain
MRRLWLEFGQVGTGYTEQDYMRLVSEVAGQPMQRYFDQFVYGTAPLEEPLSRVLNFVGCQLRTRENASAAEGIFGFRAAVKNERTEVIDILPSSPAAAALTVDDEIVAVNGRKVTMNLQSLLATGAERYELSVFRQNRLLTVSLAAQPDRRFWQKMTVEKLADATPEQQASFQQWLKQAF